MINIAIFASGSGTNAENIINHFQDNKDIKISLILTNNSDAFVIERAKKFNIDSFIFSRKEFRETNNVLLELKKYNIDYVVLAGFLLLVNQDLVDIYQNRIINIHPALLPKHGGKGMYGDNVHNSVKEHGDSQSGITIHHVNEKFDSGDIIFQATCEIASTDSPEDIAKKVHELEYRYFPTIIEQQVKLYCNSL